MTPKVGVARVTWPTFLNFGTSDSITFKRTKDLRFSLLDRPWQVLYIRDEEWPPKGVWPRSRVLLLKQWDRYPCSTERNVFEMLINPTSAHHIMLYGVCMGSVVSPQRVRVEPERQTLFGAFWAEKCVCCKERKFTQNFDKFIIVKTPLKFSSYQRGPGWPYSIQEGRRRCIDNLSLKRRLYAKYVWLEVSIAVYIAYAYVLL